MGVGGPGWPVAIESQGGKGAQRSALPIQDCVSASRVFKNSRFAGPKGKKKSINSDVGQTSSELQSAPTRHNVRSASWTLYGFLFHFPF